MKIIVATHILIFAGWIGTTSYLALDIATLGNEETVISRDRGVGLTQRRDLINRKEHLYAQLMHEARQDRLQLAVRRLDLPLHEPEDGDNDNMEVARNSPELSRP